MPTTAWWRRSSHWPGKPVTQTRATSAIPASTPNGASSPVIPRRRERRPTQGGAAMSEPEQTQDQPQQVLSGIRVLDFTERMQGPYGTQMLADLGAEVIKVERVKSLTPDGRPDERYGSRGRYGKDPDDSTFYSSAFLAANRNKKSVTVDLKSD